MNNRNDIISGDSASQTTLLFLHGTHTPYDSSWMDQIAKKLEGLPVRMIRPEFPPEYKANSEYNDQTKFLTTFLDNYVKSKDLGGDLVIMGKSLGAKVAVEFALEHNVKKLFLLGYPMTYQSGELRTDRIEKINSLQVPIHIIQGEFDRYGKQEIISKLSFEKHIDINWIDKVDHSYLIEGDEDINSKNVEVISSIIRSAF